VARTRPPADLAAPAPALLLSRDQPLIDHVSALADAVSAPLAVRGGPPPAGSSPPLLLLGLDVAADLPRGWRGGVLVVRVEGADPPEGVWRVAVEIGADRVALLPEAEPWLLEELADAASARPRAPVVGVLPGCGGAGASTLAVGLAVVAARGGASVVLVDADPLAGGLDLPLGLDALPGMRWPDVPAGPARWPNGLVDSALPGIDGVRVLTGDREDATTLRPATVGSAVDAAARESDLVVVDLPRHLGDVTAALLPRCRCTLLVAAAEVRAGAGAAQLAAVAARLSGDLRLLVRPRGPGGPDPLQVADALDVPFAGVLPADPEVAAALERGEAVALSGRGPLAALCRSVLVDVLREP
jgi:secretion/DNA translocation related CpaE-like protein